MELQSIESQLTLIQDQQKQILDELMIVKRQREEINELKNDLTFIAKDVFQSAVIELESIAPFVQSGDFLHLIKKILRNTRNISAVIEKFESTIDFLEDGKPIGKELLTDMLTLLDEMDRKGYFSFMQELLKVMDNIVTHFTEEDVKMLGENIVSILETIRNLSQPDMLMSINNAVSIYKHLDVNDIQEYTLWEAMKELKSPEMRKGMGFIISFLKNLSDNQSTNIK